MGYALPLSLMFTITLYCFPSLTEIDRGDDLFIVNKSCDLGLIVYNYH